MPNPYLINDMENAVLRIVSLIVKKQNIGIFGDYEVDGASSTALLAKYFQSINQEFNIYIPLSLILLYLKLNFKDFKLVNYFIS